MDTEITDAPLSWLLLQFVVGVACTWTLVALLMLNLRRKIARPERPPRYLAELAFLVVFLYLGLNLALAAMLPAGAAAFEGASVPQMLRTFLLANVANAGVILAGLLIARFRYHARPEDLGFGRPRGRAPWALALGLLVAFVPAFLGAALLAPQLAERLGVEPMQPVVRELQARADLRQDPLALLAIVVLAPLLEEFLFRGFVQRGARAVLPAGGAIATSAFLFAIVHPIGSALPVGVMGVAFGIAAERTGSILPSTLLHMLFNGTMLALIHHASPA